MGIIEKNHVNLMSHIIYVIYNTSDFDDMRREVLELIKYAVPYDNANFFLVKKQSCGKLILSDLVNVNTLSNSDSDIANILDRYMQECSEIDSTHWLVQSKKSIAYRTTDLYSEDTLESTDYYKKMFLPYNVHYGAQMVLSHDNVSLGLLTLFRSKEKPNFSDTEIFFLDNLRDHLAIRLSQHACTTAPTSGDNISSLVCKYNLTRRETEILTVLFEGKCNDEIAKELHISENTLRRHIYNMYTKMNIKSRWELYFLK